MPGSARRLLEEVLALPEDERLHLASEIIASVAGARARILARRKRRRSPAPTKVPASQLRARAEYVKASGVVITDEMIATFAAEEAAALARVDARNAAPWSHSKGVTSERRSSTRGHHTGEDAGGVVTRTRIGL